MTPEYPRLNLEEAGRRFPVLKLWKALATIGILVSLFLPRVQLFMPKIVGSVLLVASLTYGISLIFSSKIPVFRRLAISYLLLTALTYLLIGIWGLLPHWGLIEASAWNSVVSPYLIISFLDQWAQHFPYTVSRAPYSVVPRDEHQISAALIVGLSAVAAAASFAMSRQKKIAYRIWLVLLGIVAIELAGYVIVGFVSWGFREVILPMIWGFSYLIAYAVARRGVELG